MSTIITRRSLINEYFTPDIMKELLKVFTALRSLKMNKNEFFSYKDVRTLNYKDIGNGEVRIYLITNNDKIQLYKNIVWKYFGNDITFGTGTNRLGVIMKGYVFKFACDRAGIVDNKHEFKMAKLCQPEGCKVYEENGFMCVCEYGRVINSIAMFENYKDKIMAKLESLSQKTSLMMDVGYITKNMTNWAIRFSDDEPMIIDYGYVYTELSGLQLTCNNKACVKKHGIVDLEYTGDYSALLCPKCGAKYTSTELQTLITPEARQRMYDDIDESEFITMTKAKAYFEVDEFGDYIERVFDNSEDLIIAKEHERMDLEEAYEKYEEAYNKYKRELMIYGSDIDEDVERDKELYRQIYLESKYKKPFEYLSEKQQKEEPIYKEETMERYEDLQDYSTDNYIKNNIIHNEVEEDDIQNHTYNKIFNDVAFADNEYELSPYFNKATRYLALNEYLTRHGHDELEDSEEVLKEYKAEQQKEEEEFNDMNLFFDPEEDARNAKLGKNSETIEEDGQQIYDFFVNDSCTVKIQTEEEIKAEQEAEAFRKRIEMIDQLADGDGENSIIGEDEYNVDTEIPQIQKELDTLYDTKQSDILNSLRTVINERIPVDQELSSVLELSGYVHLSKLTVFLDEKILNKVYSKLVVKEDPKPTPPDNKKPTPKIVIDDELSSENDDHENVIIVEGDTPVTNENAEAQLEAIKGLVSILGDNVDNEVLDMLNELDNAMHGEKYSPIPQKVQPVVEESNDEEQSKEELLPTNKGSEKESAGTPIKDFNNWCAELANAIVENGDPYEKKSVDNSENINDVFDDSDNKEDSCEDTVSIGNDSDESTVSSDIFDNDDHSNVDDEFSTDNEVRSCSDEVDTFTQGGDDEDVETSVKDNIEDGGESSNESPTELDTTVVDDFTQDGNDANIETSDIIITSSAVDDEFSTEAGLNESTLSPVEANTQDGNDEESNVANEADLAKLLAHFNGFDEDEKVEPPITPVVDKELVFKIPSKAYNSDNDTETIVFVDVEIGWSLDDLDKVIYPYKYSEHSTIIKHKVVETKDSITVLLLREFDGYEFNDKFNCYTKKVESPQTETFSFMNKLKSDVNKAQDIADDLTDGWDD